VKRTIYVGWDPREALAWSVATSSLLRRLGEAIPVHSLCLSDMIKRGLYTRPMEIRADGHTRTMWDVISEAPMATEHANARWLVKELAKTGWALFMDGDILVRGDLAPLFNLLDPAMAVYCVKHQHQPPAGMKMDGQFQTRYARKNWSSVMAVNCDHPANAALTVDLINTAPGRDLHRFCWLPDDLIGELPATYNYLVGHTQGVADPVVVHFTEGLPDMAGYEDVPFADEWRAEQRRWAA
jgi:hypothetical protein